MIFIFKTVKQTVNQNFPNPLTVNIKSDTILVEGKGSVLYEM